VGGDEGAGDGQPDPGPAVGPVAGGIGAIEPFEDVRQVADGDAVAGVGDGDCDVGVRPEAGLECGMHSSIRQLGMCPRASPDV
jgi:hypothetical protein